MPANLTYYIVEGVLTGNVNGQLFHVLALSGGAAGSTKSVPEVSANNPYMEGLKARGKPNVQGHVHGGPIPPGQYTISTPAKHPHLGLSAKLTHARWKPMGRDGFYIHGCGPHGSDGCIVPLNLKQFQDLMGGLTRSKGGSLVVQEAMDDSRYA